jgi:hypothetical protein
VLSDVLDFRAGGKRIYFTRADGLYRLDL